MCVHSVCAYIQSHTGAYQRRIKCTGVHAIQEAESRVVHAKESAEAAGVSTPQARVFP